MTVTEKFGRTSRRGAVLGSLLVGALYLTLAGAPRGPHPAHVRQK